jgi:hypothetical protein
VVVFSNESLEHGILKPVHIIPPTDHDELETGTTIAVDFAGQSYQAYVIGITNLHG